MSTIIAPSPSVNTPPASDPGRNLKARLAQRARLLEQSGGGCWYCGRPLSPENADRDHQIPIARGGRGGANVVAACVKRNRSKRDLSVEEFREVLRRRRDSEPAFTDEQRRWLEDQGFRFPPHEPLVFYGEGL